MDGADRRFHEQTVKLSRRTLARLSLLIRPDARTGSIESSSKSIFPNGLSIELPASNLRVEAFLDHTPIPCQRWSAPIARGEQDVDCFPRGVRWNAQGNLGRRCMLQRNLATVGTGFGIDGPFVSQLIAVRVG